MVETVIWLCGWSFCWFDMLRVQRKSNWTVGESLIGSEQQVVWKNKQILSKAQRFLFNAWFTKSFISKKLALKEVLADVMLDLRNCQDCQMALWTDNLIYLWRRPNAPLCSGHHYYTTLFNKVWTQILHRIKHCSRSLWDLRWWDSLTMVPAGNKVQLSSSEVSK